MDVLSKNTGNCILLPELSIAFRRFDIFSGDASEAERLQAIETNSSSETARERCRVCSPGARGAINTGECQGKFKFDQVKYEMTKGQN